MFRNWQDWQTAIKNDGVVFKIGDFGNFKDKRNYNNRKFLLEDKYLETVEINKTGQWVQN